MDDGPSAATSDSLAPVFDMSMYAIEPGVQMDISLASVIAPFYAIDGDGVDCGVVLMRELEAAYAAGDGRRISVAAHALKGVAGTAGAARLSAEANGFSSAPSSESITKLWEMLAEARAAFALFEADEVAGQSARS